MATIAGMSLSSPRILAKGPGSSPQKVQALRYPLFKVNQRSLGTLGSCQMVNLRPMRATPDIILEKVEESIKNAKEVCSDDPVSRECAAAWDEVEELSAAASHTREKKSIDPLEAYCEDNPGSDECRTYDN
ncbi:hypothetical protein TanjilG_16968 [Lupinus angustifolius]|uniref:calvin cycle protein CP12-2, chloroplastic-like n=1 Tax=Lupinus angustifolius TaxID=3871 RepID=UPI00090D092A|nr:PREDICTED: calvin cycle protein CP12-2, chloroplastic-like [Lupinus angustifolius]XP_019426794.1 PREDICTED: calvin cycle protein CP12-2, chloroplastic-like [Lupinus angustifolius]XP_019426795.1 PREDICTED: calvin cycle protein CP12-2, chloroplastic-like [Lupinus angustifolius]OIV91008.1 hypothetical protein TanjilG_16968 [Lupinus angustifolius]